MKTRTLVFTLFCVLLAGCGPTHHTIKDATKSEVVILKKTSTQGSIHGMDLKCTGSIVGKAEIQRVSEGKIYQTAQLSGDFDLNWDGDWYSDTTEIRYIPHSATGGTVTLIYEFKD